MEQEKISEFIAHIMTALSSCALYSESHPLFGEYSEKALEVMDKLISEDLLALTILGDSLIFNNSPVTENSAHLDNFKKRMKRKGIEKIVMKKGVDIDELRKFIASVASIGNVKSSPHITVGIVEMKFKSEGIDVSVFMDESVSKVREVYQEIGKFRRLDMVGLEDIVAGFISTLKKEMNVLRIISSVKSYSDYTYVHATNVSILTIFQAEALGLSGESLHDIGLAGLLHDEGKVFVSKEVIEKETKLDANDWNAIRKHPIQGAKYLSTLPDVPKLAVIAAFEHHMKFNGSGYPDTKRRGKKQHIASQIVAIADFFDALRTERSYRIAMDVATTTELMKEASGRDFNPLLVENFLNALKRIGIA